MNECGAKRMDTNGLQWWGRRRVRHRDAERCVAFALACGVVSAGASGPEDSHSTPASREYAEATGANPSVKPHGQQDPWKRLQLVSATWVSISTQTYPESHSRLAREFQMKNSSE